MTSEQKKQMLVEMAEDIEQAKAMSSIEAPEDLLILLNHLIAHLGSVLNFKAEKEFEISKLDGSKKVLEQYIMIGKQRYKELTDIRRFTNS